MFEYFSKPKLPLYYLNYDSFLLCRPCKSYKVNANVSIIKDEHPILYDIGLDWYMVSHITNSLKVLNKTPKDVKQIVISHFHPDHYLNLLSIRRFFSNARIIIHKNAYEYLTDFTRSFKERKSSSNIKIINFYTKIMEFLEGYYILKKNDIYICEDNDFLPQTEAKLKIIHTPGHSIGHICLHDCTNKVLFLGDHLPFTPWLDISNNSLDNMISSIQKLLNLSTHEVRYSVRGHGNINDNSREVYPWNEEKARFQKHLNLIFESIEKVYAILQDKPMTANELADQILRNKDYREYSSLMNILFMAPNITWVYCYLLKLKKEGKIKRKRKKWYAV